MAVVVELRKPDRAGSARLLHPRPEDERSKIIRLCHEGRCTLLLSFRNVQRHLADNGYRVSLGMVVNHVRDYECDRCADG